ncbi:Unannotated [Lentimonas sp. CC19]|nr:Unannotated [Lentimonas sp. CC10]CAA6697519.1 Unannotated [Lentimonas sp. CC19]CAA7071243.1 Unannotated [Lentimonas sp. CC11]
MLSSLKSKSEEKYEWPQSVKNQRGIRYRIKHSNNTGTSIKEKHIMRENTIRLLGIETGNADDMKNWSGTPFHIYDAFREAGCEVTLINYAFNIPSRSGLFRRLKVQIRSRIYRFLGKKKYDPIRDPDFLIPKIQRIEQEIAGHEYDCIFSTSTIVLSYLKTPKPKYFWTDAVFAGLVDYYEEFSNLSKLTLKHGLETEQKAIANVTRAFFSSEWARQIAIAEIPSKASHIHTVQFGANLHSNHETCPAANWEHQLIEFVFIGTDWVRKGGDLAVAVVEQLNTKGYPCTLHIIGVTPEGLPDFCKIHGFLSKDNPSQFQEFEQILNRSHFFILPTKAECSAIVFSEANSYGLPALSIRTGGLTSVVEEDINGFLFPHETFIDDCVRKVSELLDDRPEYEQLRIRSFNRYQTVLNWETAVSRILEVIQSDLQ